jgi:hypothetical protein
VKRFRSDHHCPAATLPLGFLSGAEVTVATEPLKAPFPYAGGKSRVASMVWERFGNVANYIEPFAGSSPRFFAGPPNTSLMATASKRSTTPITIW